MAKEKQASTSDDLQEEITTKKPKAKEVDKGDIVNMISQLPVKERMDLIRDLQTAAATDADYFSSGRPETISHYDTLRDGYHVKAKEVEEQPE